MTEIRLPYFILGLIFSAMGMGLVFYSVKTRPTLIYTHNNTVYDRKLFDGELYQNWVRRIIRQSGHQPSVVYNTSNATTGKTEKGILKPPCKGITRIQNRPLNELTMARIEQRNSDLSRGGTWKPQNCTAQHRVAIIIPYRDRYNHLVRLLAALVPILKQQNIYFKIYVTEQFGNYTFNKGVLMNAAFKEALKEEAWQCFIFHDVDLIPESVHNMYTCPWQPRHMSVSIDEFNYDLPPIFDTLVGGVFAIRTEHFQDVNGYSNSYWGWGAEDDDMSARLLKKGFRIDRPPYHVARYQMVKHKKRKHNPYRHIIYSKNSRLYQTDGLNSLNYTLVTTTETTLYTNLLIDVGHPPKLWYFPLS